MLWIYHYKPAIFWLLLSKQVPLNNDFQTKHILEAHEILQICIFPRPSPRIFDSLGLGSPQVQALAEPWGVNSWEQGKSWQYLNDSESNWMMLCFHTETVSCLLACDSQSLFTYCRWKSGSSTESRGKHSKHWCTGDCGMARWFIQLKICSWVSNIPLSHYEKSVTVSSARAKQKPMSKVSASY